MPAYSYHSRRLPAPAICLWGVLTGFAGGDALAQSARTTPGDNAPLQSTAQELVRVQNLVRANVLGLAQEILETRAPAAQSTPTPEWLQWERQLWAVYRVQGHWQKLYERTRNPPPGLPREVRREAQLQAIHALTVLKRGSAARRLIRRQWLADIDASQPADARQRQPLREAMIAAYLADNLLPEARIALDHFRKDYGARGTTHLLLSAAVRLQSGEPGAAINLLAPLDQPAARLMRLYARLVNQTLTPAQVIERARELIKTPQGKSLRREIRAVIAQANIQAGESYALAAALEDYLLTPPSRATASNAAHDHTVRRVYPQFEITDLFAVYADITRAQANRAGLLIGEEWRWLQHALALPPGAVAARKAWFAHLAAAAQDPALRRRAVDEYVNILIDTGRTALIAHLFGRGQILGELSLGGRTALRLAGYALSQGDFRLAADANAAMREFPEGNERTAWLLQAGRIDILAGRPRLGAGKLDEWIESFERLDAAQTDAALQPIFDLQTIDQHALALALLHKINARAPAGNYPREIAYWLAESYSGDGQYHAAADLFLHSALQREDGFDEWGRAARFRAAEALMNAQLFEDARRLFEDLLTRATTEQHRNTLTQKLQRLSLLESKSKKNEP